MYIVLNFITSLGKKTDIPFYSTVHKFQIIFPCSSLSLSVHCLRFTMKTITCFIPFSLFMHEGRERGKEIIFRASRIVLFIKLINSFFLGHFFFFSFLQLFFCLSLPLGVLVSPLDTLVYAQKFFRCETVWSFRSRNPLQLRVTHVTFLFLFFF